MKRGETIRTALPVATVLTMGMAIIGFLPGVVSAQTAEARVGDVTRIKGQSVNRLAGWGLVTGLNKTGDGDGYLPTMRHLAKMMQRFGSPIDELDDLDGTKNVAIVAIQVEIPEHGAREGNLLDVYVTANAAKSLRGGYLASTPLVYHDHTVEGLFGFAQGRIVVDENTPTVGKIHGGARMERDVFMHVTATGRQLRLDGITSAWIDDETEYVTMILDDAHAGWPMAAAVAQAINKELGISADLDRVALAVDSRNIVVLIPAQQRNDLASWISDIERTRILMESNEARVTVNRTGGTIVLTGDVRISPVIVSQAGMTITVANALPDGTVPLAATTQQRFVGVEAGAKAGAKVGELLEALNRLDVPFEKRVSILEEIHRAGKLHAPILYER